MSREESETLHADIEPSRVLPIQWTIVGWFVVGVGIGAFRKHLSLIRLALVAMAPDKATTVAVALLAVAAVLLVNPIYLQADDRGNQFIQVERVSPAEGAAKRSADVERIHRLPAVPRYAARQSLEAGSFRLDRSDPGLVVTLLDSEWQYLGAHSPDHVYRPNVSVGETESTVTFTAVPVETVEQELAITPPEGVRDDDSPRRIAWLSEQTDAVVFVGEFGEPWEDRLGDAVTAGEMTVSHGTNASTLQPLGGEVAFLVDGDDAYRASVRETNRTVILETSPVSTRTVLEKSEITTISTGELSPATRQLVVSAIRSEDGYHRFDREDADMEAVEGLTDAVIRHDGAYYVLYRSHSDDFSLVPLFRLILTAVGAIIGLSGLYIGYRARR